MRVAVVNPVDLGGGAARVAFEVAKGLRDRGHEVTFLVARKRSDAEFVREIQKRPQAHKRSLLDRVTHRVGLDSLCPTATFPGELGSYFWKQFDVIHLHDVQGMGFNLLHLPWLTQQAPTCWTLHTLAPLTGNCLYPYDCDRWRHHCGRCPQFGEFPLNYLHRDGSRIVHWLRQLTYRRCKLELIAVSEWVKEHVSQGILRQFPCRTIENGVDTVVFQPMSKGEARGRLGVPQGRHCVLFSVAGNPLDRRKGTDTIIEALRLLPPEKYFLIPLGITDGKQPDNDIYERFGRLPFRHISSKDELRVHYSAADVVWHPSRADTSSMVILEANACGTPAIAAKVGGVPSVIEDGVTGVLIPPANPRALALATDTFFANGSVPATMGRAARWSVERRFAAERLVSDHEKLYFEMLRT